MKNCDNCYHINHVCEVLSREGKQINCNFYETEEEHLRKTFFYGIMCSMNEKLALCTYEPYRKTFELQKKWCQEAISDRIELEKLRDRLQQSPYGDDKIDELEEAIENFKFQIECLERKNQ